MSLEDRAEILDEANKILASNLWRFYYLYRSGKHESIVQLFEELDMNSIEE